MIRDEAFHYYLKNRRIKLGFTQTQLAKMVNVAISTINHIEAGDYTRFPLKKVHNLADALNEDRDKFSILWIEAILKNKKEQLHKKIYNLGS